MMEKVVELNAEQLTGLERTLAKSWTGDTALDYVLCVKGGVFDAWVPASAKDAVVITQIVIHPAGRCLFLLAVAGRGILKVGKEVVADLREIAIANRCRFIATDGIPKGWERYGPALGFRPVATTYLTEV